jgi:hypothetical protein
MLFFWIMCCWPLDLLLRFWHVFDLLLHCWMCCWPLDLLLTLLTCCWLLAWWNVTFCHICRSPICEEFGVNAWVSGYHR